MIKTSLHIVILLIFFSKTTLCQNVNLIIQINEKLITTPLNTFLTFDSLNSKHFDITYVPGDLSIDTILWKKINIDSTKHFWLHFYYTTFSKGKQNNAHFFIELTPAKLKNRYSILNIYDFRDKKYKHWYQRLTTETFLAELTFPGSGIFIRQK